MIVSEVAFRREGRVSRLRARVQTNSGKRRDQVAFILVQGELRPPQTLGDSFLAACLIPAMFLGERLEIRAPVSMRLVASARAIQEIFCGWYPTWLHPVPIRVPETVVPSDPSAGQTGCFFSGGVDSWYSVLKQRERISYLVTVKGFDIPCADATLWPQLVAANQVVASQLGLPLWLVETNLRDCIDPAYPGLGKQFQGDFWGQCLHGSFLGAVGLALQAHVGQMIVPSTFAQAALHPWGSHPSVDSLWSTEHTRFLHDGCEANRIEKLQLLTKTDVCLQHLRVCPTHMPGRYNCGKCEKCLRTLLGLYLVGASDRALSFPEAFSLEKLLSLELRPAERLWYEEMLETAVALNRPDAARACRVLLGQESDTRREFKLVLRKLGRVVYWPWQLIGGPRWQRSIQKRKRWLKARLGAAKA